MYRIFYYIAKILEDNKGLLYRQAGLIVLRGPMDIFRIINKMLVP